jgi:hypothetical protein
MLVPTLIGSLPIMRSSTVARVLEAVPQQWLVGIQSYRALGIMFLILYAAGKAYSLGPPGLATCWLVASHLLWQSRMLECPKEMEI